MICVDQYRVVTPSKRVHTKPMLYTPLPGRVLVLKFSVDRPTSWPVPTAVALFICGEPVVLYSGCTNARQAATNAPAVNASVAGSAVVMYWWKRKPPIAVSP